MLRRKNGHHASLVVMAATKEQEEEVDIEEDAVKAILLHILVVLSILSICQTASNKWILSPQSLKHCQI